MNPRVLLIDDDVDILDSYEDLLRAGGYAFGRARSGAEALRRLDAEGPWDVVLVDERLSGPGGGASATPLIEEIAARAPSAHVIVVTGFARKELVASALAAGAWDYLQKDGFIELLLPVKVRQAVTMAVARRIARAPREEVEGSLRATWAECQAATDRQRKGGLLEQTLKLVFHTMPGLEYVTTNWRSEVEELDLVVRNESLDPLLSREGSIWLVECKNWTARVDPKEIRVLRDKLRSRHGRAGFGIFVAAGGFTSNVTTVLQQQSNEPELIVAIDGAQLDAWIQSTDRVAWLKERLQGAILRAP